MAITRRALLVSNPGEVGDEHYCQGVPIDIANYKRFLREACGGWWQSTEIVERDRLTVNQMRQEVAALEPYDYSFIAFAGHGWFSSSDNSTVLTLRKGERISALELLTGAKKRTLVLDCCREIRNESVLSLSASEKRAMFEAEGHRRQPIPQLCREKFLLDISTASNASVLLHSCSPNQTSGDDQIIGGRYTSSLLGGAHTWAEGIADNAWSNSTEGLSVVAAHEVAAKRTTARSGGNQTPYIEKPRTERNFFPFAVFA